MRSFLFVHLQPSQSLHGRMAQSKELIREILGIFPSASPNHQESQEMHASPFMLHGIYLKNKMFRKEIVLCT